MIVARLEHSENPRQAFVLLAVLVVVVLLTLASYQYSELVTAEYKAANSYSRSVKAKAYAESGINYASMLLSDAEGIAGLGGNPYQNPSVFQGVIIDEHPTPGLQGRFSIVSPFGPDDVGSSGIGGFRYGAVDEAGKINLNGLLKIDPSGDSAASLLQKLPNMTEDLANAIIDWLDGDDEPRTGGAEADSYAGLGYRPRNGPLSSLEELLYVQGMTPEILFGNDRNRNGTLDPEEDDGTGTVDFGLSAYLTVYSREQNITAAGEPRTYLNDRDTNTLFTSLKEVLDEDMARYIMAYRNQSNQVRTVNPEEPVEAGAAADLSQEALGLGGRRSRRLASIFELVDTIVEIPAQNPREQPQRFASPLNDSERLKELLPQLLDLTTTTRDTDLPVRININTAPRAVLRALPGIDEDDTLVDTILATRPDSLSGEAPDEIFLTPAWLLTEAGLEVSTLRTLERFITARTQVFRIQSVGYYDEGGPTRRIEAIIDTNRGRPRVVYWRDLTELGRGFQLNGSEEP